MLVASFPDAAGAAIAVGQMGANATTDQKESVIEEKLAEDMAQGDFTKISAAAFVLVGLSYLRIGLRHDMNVARVRMERDNAESDRRLAERQAEVALINQKRAEFENLSPEGQRRFREQRAYGHVSTYLETRSGTPPLEEEYEAAMDYQQHYPGLPALDGVKLAEAIKKSEHR